MKADKNPSGALAVHVRLLETIFDMIPTAVLAKDLSGNMLLGNQAAADMLNVKKERIATQSDEDLGFGRKEGFEATRADDRLILRTGQTIEAEKEVEFADGRTEWMHHVKGPFRGADGEIAGFVAVWRNISGQKQAEENLRVSEKLYRNLVEGSVQGIMVIGLERFFFVNETCARIYGYDSPEEILALRPNHDLIAPADRERSKRYALARFAGGKLPTHFEVQGLRKDGSTIVLDLMARLIDWGDQKAIQVTCTDATEKKQTRAEMIERKLEALGTLAQGIAGEVSDILGRFFSSLARARMEAYAIGAERITEELSDTEQVADEAQELINKLVLLCRGGVPTKEPVSIPDLIIRCIPGHSRQQKVVALKRRKHAVAINIEPDLPLIMADKLQVKQLLSTLFNHAADSMPFGGKITISAVKHIVKGANRALHLPPGDYIKVSVKDQGERLSGNTVLRIFDPYFATKKESFGEGLSSAYSIAKNHGGTITAQSAGKRGARMTVFLPCN